MSAIEPDKKQWSDPKDYGLPYVEIAPIVPKSEPELAISEQAHPEVSSYPSQVLDESAASEIELGAAMVEEKLENFPKNQTSSSDSKSAEEEKSKSWQWAVLLVGLGIVGVIIWQLQANLNTTAGEGPVAAAEESIQQPPPPSPSQTTADSTLTDQNQDTVNQQNIDSLSVSNPNISKPTESGTTIANTAVGNLIRVESKAAQAQYFIIVGSLPNERMALEEANKYLGSSTEIYLIEPFDGGKNYRLALSKFDSFKVAAANLEEIKSQYTEELWILKY